MVNILNTHIHFNYTLYNYLKRNTDLINLLKNLARIYYIIEYLNYIIYNFNQSIECIGYLLNQINLCTIRIHLSYFPYNFKSSSIFQTNLRNSLQYKFNNDQYFDHINCNTNHRILNNSNSLTHTLHYIHYIILLHNLCNYQWYSITLRDLQNNHYRSFCKIINQDHIQDNSHFHISSTRLHIYRNFDYILNKKNLMNYNYHNVHLCNISFNCLYNNLLYTNHILCILGKFNN